MDKYLAIGVGTSSFYGLLVGLGLLLSRKGNVPANRCLGAFLTLFIYSILVHAIRYADVISSFPFLVKTDVPLAFLYGPFIFFHFFFWLIMNSMK